MAVPKRRRSKARKLKHRSHMALKSPGLSSCPRCSASKEAHAVCPNCGHYKGQEVLRQGPS